MVSTLVAHSGAFRSTEQAAQAVQTPAATPTWRPIAHGRIFDDIRSYAADHNWRLKPTGCNGDHFRVALKSHGSVMFAVADIESDKPFLPDRYGLSIGIRNSHDKSLALGFALGARVFVCDNLAFSGEIVVKRQHRPNVDPPSMLERLFNELLPRVVLHAELLDKIDSTRMQPADAAEFLLRASHLGALKARHIANIWRGVERSIVQSQPVLLGSLYQSITSSWKGASPFTLVDRSRTLNRLTRVTQTAAAR